MLHIHIRMYTCRYVDITAKAVPNNFFQNLNLNETFRNLQK